MHTWAVKERRSRAPPGDMREQARGAARRAATSRGGLVRCAEGWGGCTERVVGVLHARLACCCLLTRLLFWRRCCLLGYITPRRKHRTLMVRTFEATLLPRSDRHKFISSTSLKAAW